MENAVALAKVMGPVYLMLGLSIVMYLPSWKKLMEKYIEDHYSLFTLYFVCGVLGAISINMYNSWEWNVWLLVTLTGWALAIKSVAYFLLPGGVIKKLLHFKKYTSLIMLDGVLSLIIGLVMVYNAFMMA